MTEAESARPDTRPDTRPAGRRTFGPVVVLGLAAGALLAVGGSKPWVVPAGTAQLSPALGADTGEVPLAGALGLVVLAVWGVLLVTRGRVRTVLAVLAALAGAGALATVVRGRSQAGATLADELGVRSVATDPTGWFWVCAVAAPVALLTAVAAVRLARTWPAMGSRYDAPRTAGPDTAEPSPPSRRAETPGDPQLELWRALDRGQDPTA